MYGTKFIKLCIVDQYVVFFFGGGDSFLFYSTAIARPITSLFFRALFIKNCVAIFSYASLGENKPVNLFCSVIHCMNETKDYNGGYCTQRSSSVRFWTSPVDCGTLYRTYEFHRYGTGDAELRIGRAYFPLSCDERKKPDSVISLTHIPK